MSSSINDTVTELKVYNFTNEMKDWHASIIDGKDEASDFFFTIVVKFNDIIIPDDYILNKRLSEK